MSTNLKFNNIDDFIEYLLKQGIKYPNSIYKKCINECKCFTPQILLELTIDEFLHSDSYFENHCHVKYITNDNIPLVLSIYRADHQEDLILMYFYGELYVENLSNYHDELYDNGLYQQDIKEPDVD